LGPKDADEASDNELELAGHELRQLNRKNWRSS
jgi:hypothetical protein